MNNNNRVLYQKLEMTKLKLKTLNNKINKYFNIIIDKTIK